MRKLQLTLDDLEVVSFEMDSVEEAEGTVEANEMDFISGNRLTCKTCLTNLTCCTPLI